MNYGVITIGSRGDNFSNAIYQVTHDQQMIKKSQEIGNILNAENGVENAIQIFERKTMESKQFPSQIW